MRQDYERFLQAGAEVAAVNPERAETVRDYWEKNDLPFAGLADPDHRVARLYGQQFKLLRLGRMPLLLVIDRNGRIRYRHAGHSMSDIPENEDVLDLLARMDAQEGV